MGAAVENAAERGEADSLAAAGDRSNLSRSRKTVTKRNRRRLCGATPNSRESRGLPR